MDLLLDNAPCQDGLRGWIVGNGYQSPGFVSARRSHPHGTAPITCRSLQLFLDVSKFCSLTPVQKQFQKQRLNEDCGRA
jgi:hypothetical protein